MTETAALFRLMSWLTPGYPVGAYSYSHGLETVVEAGEVHDRATLQAWIGDVIGHGSGRNDAILLAAVWRGLRAGDAALVHEAAELAAVLVATPELRLETTAQGRAFLETTRAVWPAPALERLVAIWDGPYAYPVAVGAAAAGHDVPLEAALGAYLHAFAANLVSAGLRLVPLGQTDGQRALAGLEPDVAAVIEETKAAGLDDLGSATILADIASIRHETLYTRLFRS